MKFHICRKCHTKGVIPGYDALLSLRTEDGVWLCGLCEKRVGKNNPFYILNMRVRRICSDVYAILPFCEERFKNLSSTDNILTQSFYKKNKG